MKKYSYPLLLVLTTFAFGLVLIFVLRQFLSPSASNLILIFTLPLFAGSFSAFVKPVSK
jgi:hypothetical protein